MSKTFLTLLLVTTLISISSAQVTIPKPKPRLPKKVESRGSFGINDVTQIEKFLYVVSGVGSPSHDFLNEQSVKSYMMPPRKMNSATESAVYAVTACFEYYQNLNSNFKDNLSPDFIRLNVTENAIESYLNFLAAQGTVSAAIFPYGSNSLLPSVQSAMKFKIKNYLNLFQSTTRGQQKVYELRKSLLRGHPVIIELPVNEQTFSSLSQIKTWKYEKLTAASSLHYLIVVSYNDERSMFEVMNSDGKGWGSGGYLWISYDDIANFATRGFVVVN